MRQYNSSKRHVFLMSVQISDEYGFVAFGRYDVKWETAHGRTYKATPKRIKQIKFLLNRLPIADINFSMGDDKAITIFIKDSRL